MKNLLAIIFMLVAINITSVNAQKISAFPAATTQADADLTLCVQSGVTKKTTFAIIKTWIQSWVYSSPTLTGTPVLPTGTTGTTQSAADNTTKIATTAFVTTADNLKANLASPTFTGTPTLPTGTIATTQSAGNSSTAIATTAFATGVASYGQYKTISDFSSSHIAGQVAGTYILTNGNAAPVSAGSGTLYTIGIIYIAAADYATVNGVAAKLRIRAECIVNDVAPTGNFTFGLYPVTHTGTTGGAGLNIYTLGTVVSGSNGAAFTTPAADAISVATGSDFALPSDGFYAIGVVTTATVAASSLVHLHAQLQYHNN